MAKQPPRRIPLFKAYTHYVFLLLWLLYFLTTSTEWSSFPSSPFLKADWGLTDAQCGAMVSAVYWAKCFYSWLRLDRVFIVSGDFWVEIPSSV